MTLVHSQSTTEKQSSLEPMSWLAYLTEIIYVYNLEKNELVYVNHPDFLGYESAFLKDLHRSMLNIHEHDHTQLAKFWRKCFEGNQPHQIQFMMFSKEGNLEWVELDFRPMKFDESMVFEFMGTLKVISQRKAYESVRLEVEIERKKREFLSEVIEKLAHEFRTPLSIIQTQAHLAQRKIGTQVIDKNVEKINQQVMTLVDYFTQLVQNVRQNVVYQHDYQLVELQKILQEVHQRLETTLLRYQVKMQVHPLDEFLEIEANPNDLRDVLIHLFYGLSKICPKDSTLNVQQLLGTDYVGLQISVLDTQGNPMPLSTLEQILNRALDETEHSSEFGLRKAFVKLATQRIDFHLEDYCLSLKIPLHPPLLSL
jgi:PAS domain S-box-containing protein